MSVNSTTVRISLELHELLKSLAEQSSVSMQEILQEALFWLGELCGWQTCPLQEVGSSLVEGRSFSFLPIA